MQKEDPDRPNNVILAVNVDKHEKVKIAEITFVGNEFFAGFKASETDEGNQGEECQFLQSFQIY